MNPGFFERVTDVFDAVRRLPPAERAACIDERCGGDEKLKAEVVSLLAHHDMASGLISESTLANRPGQMGLRASGYDLGSVVRSTDVAPDQVGPFKILEKLGEGGMGVVYLAEQTDPVRRRAAVKVIKLGMDTREVVARFEAERNALALMDHPNIATIFDAGATEDGRPYFAMEVVEGIPITRYCDRHRLSVAERLELFLQACQGVQHAHNRGIIHRDIKPSNILVAMPDDKPVAKIIDFGVARATNQRLTEKTIYTELGRAVGTPEFMSPEQAEMSGERVDHRTDVYSLGVLLYELLVGHLPLELNAQSVRFDEIIRRIREEEPVTPSTRWSRLNVERTTRIAAERKTSPGSLRHELRGDLDSITMKAIAKERERRYATASEFAADITRHLRNEPILARSPGLGYRLQKAWRRNRVAYSAALAVTFALIAGIVVSAWQARLATRSRDEAQANLEQAIEAEDRAQQALAELRGQKYAGDVNLAYEAFQRGDLGRSRNLLEKHVPGPDEEDLREFAWRLVWSLSQGNYTADLGVHRGFLMGIAISPDGKFVALSRGRPPRVEVVHLATGTVEKSLEPGQAVTYSPSGNLLIGMHGGEVVGWDTRTWEAREPLDLDSPLAFGHGTEEEFFVARDGDHFTVWNATDWRKIGDLANDPGAEKLLEPGFGEKHHMTSALAVSSEIVYLAGAKGIRRWDLDHRTELAPFRVNTPRPYWGEGLSCVATSPQGQLAAGDRWGQVHLIDPVKGEVMHTFPSHTGWVSCLTFAQNANRLVSGGGDRTVVIHDPLKRSIVDRLLGHRSQLYALDVSADGGTVVSGGAYGDHVLKWSIAETAGSVLDNAGIQEFFVLRNGRILFRRSARGLESYDPIGETFEPAGAARFARTLSESGARPRAASPNAKWALFPEGRTFVVWNLLTDARERTLSHQAGGIDRARFSPDSRLLVSAGSGSEARLWRTDDWSSEALYEKASRLWHIRFSGDSRRVAIAELGAFRVFDLAGSPRQILENRGLIPFSVALSTDGRYVAAGHQDAVIRVWDLETKERVAALEGHIHGVFSLCFSPDDRTLASACASATLKLWHVATWQELISVEADVDRLRFSPHRDGRYLAAMIIKSDSDLFEGDRAGLRILKAPTLAEIDARASGPDGRRISTGE